MFGRTPQLQAVPRKTINPQNAVSSTATVAHKTARVLQRARMKQGDAPKTLKCSLRTNARYVQRPPTVSNTQPERRVRCAIFSQRWHKWHERTFLRIAARKTKRNQVLPGSTVFMRDETLLMVSTAQPDSLSTRTISILA